MTLSATQTWGAIAAPTPVFFFNGNNGYAFNGQNVSLNAEQIVSPNNFAGQLSLQLWALETVFEGKQLHGHHIATLELDFLNSGYAFANISQELEAKLPTSGSYHMVLALVENQDGVDYIHDWRGYALTETFVEASKADSPIMPAAKMDEVTAEDVAKAVAALTTPSAIKPEVTKAEPKKKAPEKRSEKPVAKTPAPKAASKKTVAKTPAPKATSKQPVAKKTAPKAATRKTTSTASKLVNLQKDSVDTIAQLKGISFSVAEGIVAGRPYKKLDDLLKVKGIGDKLLQKIQSQVKL
ncbi:MAG: helix-hairpin-helix domain-containing protein [Opitutaceae bacterium]